MMALASRGMVNPRHTKIGCRKKKLGTRCNNTQGNDNHPSTASLTKIAKKSNGPLRRVPKGPQLNNPIDNKTYRIHRPT